MLLRFYCAVLLTSAKYYDELTGLKERARMAVAKAGVDLRSTVSLTTSVQSTFFLNHVKSRELEVISLKKIKQKQIEASIKCK